VPLDLITLLALVSVVAAFLGIVYQVLLRIFQPGVTPSGFSTLIVLVLFMGGIQLLCLSIIGGYLAHIYEEVKRRPPFVVESILNPPAEVPEAESRGA
jgi:dolichol-phosphate mannosyltransferase